ncbi:hypothetical protein KAJ61_02680 [Candidatus Parcubacteria bacterium]|nr:hypothetical protein [Candidatus Parcubacteria bacterium]
MSLFIKLKNNIIYYSFFLFLIIIFSIFFCANFVLATAKDAIDIKIFIENDFKIGQNVSFDYNISVSHDINISYVEDVSCESAPHAPLKTKQTKISKDNVIRQTYNAFAIDDSIDPQICIASIEILEPIQKKVEKEFKIDTEPSFYFRILLCKGKPCAEKTKVFILNSDIYFDYISEVESPEIIAKLIYPDKTEKQIILPTQIKAEQVGNYELEITVKKDGYKTVSKKDMFGVIATPAKIKSASICNVDGKCSGQETAQNCPQDCVKVEQAIDKINVINIKIIILIIAIIIIIAIMITVYWFLIKRGKEKNEL